MRIVFSILLLALFPYSVFAQDTSPFHINQLPANGILLNKGWKVQAGDNPDWAKPEFNDAAWESVDPTIDIHDLPALWKNNIVWFRLKFTIDDSLRQHPLSLTINQRGASEIYVNGKVIYQFGIVSVNPDKIIANVGSIFGKPFLFPTNSDSIYDMAIRYALQPGLRYTTNTAWTNPVFRLNLNNLNQANNLYSDNIKRWSSPIIFRIGCFFILFVLHLSFYLYSPSQRANLYFSLFALFVILTDSFQVPLSEITSVKYLFYNRNLVLDLVLFSTFTLVTAIYSLLKQERGRIYWSLLALLILGIVLNTFTYRLGDKVSLFLIINLFNLEITRVAFVAVKLKQKGSKIIIIGTIGFLVFWSVFILGIALNFKDTVLISPYAYGDFLYNLAFLSVPIATSIYLGLDFAFTSASLKQRLLEVESLSREKQQILSTQKEMLEQQVNERTAQLKQSLTELRTTQAQLIQSEKMASLGELTAGIAHEIQNPLNFVNNFSETNVELIQEAAAELKAGNQNEIFALLDNIKENEQKINQHGKRADSIVKGMLEHSRASKGERQLIDINVLADEYLRLAYHGLRAKDKNFNATIETLFDASIGKVAVVPQEIGRVLLNLFNNAFWAVNEKQKQVPDDYEPLIVVSSKKANNKVEIIVKDNGNGIPQAAIDKVFQPFYTTKCRASV